MCRWWIPCAGAEALCTGLLTTWDLVPGDTSSKMECTLHQDQQRLYSARCRTTPTCQHLLAVNRRYVAALPLFFWVVGGREKF